MNYRLTLEKIQELISYKRLTKMKTNDFPLLPAHVRPCQCIFKDNLKWVQHWFLNLIKVILKPNTQIYKKS